MQNLKNFVPGGGGPPKALIRLLQLGAGVGGLGWLGYNSLYTVEGGERAVIFNRIYGVRDHVYSDGTHMMIPWFDTPHIFDVRERPKKLTSPTGTKDMQMATISLRILFYPKSEELPQILSRLGDNYDERVLPSIVNETLKSIVAQYSSQQLIQQREQVSQRIRRDLTERAEEFGIVIADTSITHLEFGSEYMNAVEAKQVAQQKAEEAKYEVMRAEQQRKSYIIEAQGEAQAAEVLGKAISNNPGYIQLQRFIAAKEVAHTLARSTNRLYLNADSLMINTGSGGWGENTLDSTNLK